MCSVEDIIQGEDTQGKLCVQCHQEKDRATQFYRRKNRTDGYMKICKECYNANRQETERLVREAYERRQQELALQRQRELEEQQRLREEEERRRQEQREQLARWYAALPDRRCIACYQIKAAEQFGFTSYDTDPDGHLVPHLLQRCKPCHENYLDRNLTPCVLCMQGIKTPMGYVDGYALFGGGTRIVLCCYDCAKKFHALPLPRQQFYVRARIDLAFPPPQVVYAEVDPRNRQIRYIGRTGQAKRRHSEHKRNIYEDPSIYRHYDQETHQFIDISYESRANWMHELKQQRREPIQRILLNLDTSAYIIEYEQRHIWHAIQQGWPISNHEAVSTVLQEKVKNTSIDFLQAPFEDLVQERWFSAKGIEACIREWYPVHTP